MDQGKLYAYRVVDDSIELAASGLARPIRIYTLSINGTVSEIEPTERQALGNTCEGWREAERELARQIFGLPEPSEPEPEVPKPQ